MQSSSKRSMRSRVCEQEVIVSTRKAVLFRKIHALSIFPLERKRSWPETCVMRSHENDATPRGIMFTGATRSFPQACHIALFGMAPPIPSSTCTPSSPAPSALLLPCSAGPFGVTGETTWFPPQPTAHQLQPDSSLTGGVVCFAFGFVLG